MASRDGIDAPGTIYIGANIATRVSIGKTDAILVDNSTIPPTVTINGLVPGTTPLTTKGDLLTTNGLVIQRLPVGANGNTLLADSTQALGVKWGGITPSAAAMVYVDVGGSDSNPGTILEPFATVHAANASITDATPTKRYIISIGPGAFNGAALAVKANVGLRGIGYVTTRLNFALNLTDPSWNDPAATSDNRLIVADLSLVGPLSSLDFNSQSSGAGKAFFYNVRSNNGLVVTGFNAINQLTMEGCTWLAQITITGMATTWLGNFIVNGANLVVSSIASMPTSFEGIGGVVSGNASFAHAGGNPAVTVSLDGLVTQGTLTISGTSATAAITGDSLPILSKFVVGGGASFTFLNSGQSELLRAGTGTPEGAVTAAVGTLYLRRDGGAATTLYVKESGAGNTGWVAK